MPERDGHEPLLRRVTVAEAAALFPVIESAFPTWPVFAIEVPSIDHLRWKMAPPAHLPDDQHAVVEIDGTPVAIQLRWPGRGHVRGVEHPLDTGCDMGVHASFRGLGLASVLRDGETERRRLTGSSIGYDTPSVNERVIQMYSDRGYLRRPLGVWARSLNTRAFLATHRRAGVLHLGRAVLAAVARRGRQRGLNGAPTARGTVTRVSAFDHRATALWETVRAEYDFGRIRDAAWLNWRYLDPRAGRIAAYALTEGDRLLGYVAVRRDLDRARILDLVTDPSVADVGARLLTQAVSDLEGSAVQAIECLLPLGHREEATLRAAAFAPTGETRPVQITRTRHAWLPELIAVMEDAASPIHVMLGDFDHG
ncbi:MAG: hypothetical protein O3A10_06810 [Chloroflexi bacterium]|nr:hypothetical protein [Chloroflexota bacterium]MDA1147035.1 hypothetical protein [Chloroflexota bacterium]